jgi:hypothetical protein
LRWRYRLSEFCHFLISRSQLRPCVYVSPTGSASQALFARNGQPLVALRIMHACSGANVRNLLSARRRPARALSHPLPRRKEPQPARRVHGLGAPSSRAAHAYALALEYSLAPPANCTHAEANALDASREFEAAPGPYAQAMHAQHSACLKRSRRAGDAKGGRGPHLVRIRPAALGTSDTYTFAGSISAKSTLSARAGADPDHTGAAPGQRAVRRAPASCGIEY